MARVLQRSEEELGRGSRWASGRGSGSSSIRNWGEGSGHFGVTRV